MLGTLSEDGSPLLRIGDNIGIALDFDGRMPLPEELPAPAIGTIRTQRGLHVLFAATPAGRHAAASIAWAADPSHKSASEACGSWDLRLTDKETRAPRTLVRCGPALVAGSPEAATFETIAGIWRHGGGLIQDTSGPTATHREV